MIICPWCGTTYMTFQSNCSNCGAPLQAADERTASSPESEEPSAPPSAPRPISGSYVWRLLSSDGWAIASFVFGLLGFIFFVVGAGLTLGLVTAFVGIPFLLLGILFLISGGGIVLWRYQNARNVVTVLREGEATRGEIVDVQQNFNVRINGRSPWVIRYRFQVNGANYESKVSALNQPGAQFQAGKPAYILYLPSAPKWNSIYPHP